MRGRSGAVLLVLVLALAGCGSSKPDRSAAAHGSKTPAGSPSADPTSVTTASKRVMPNHFHPGNPNGRIPVPAAARAVDTSHPDRTVGHGKPGGCTSAAVVAAVAKGGVIRFDCGPDPITITMKATAKVRNASPSVVLDGRGTVTLSGGGARRILYMNTCDQAQGWTTSHCQDQATPRLTVQNMTFTSGNSTGDRTEGGGGGAIFVRGGRFKAVNTEFTGNRCDRLGPDLGGAAVRVLSQSRNLPVYIVNSTFRGGSCSNGGALSSIGVTWVVLNSLMTGNSAVGNGANPARAGSAGGGSGGAVYTDGNRYTVRVAGTVIENNNAHEGGGAIFFVSNDHTGTMSIEHSTLHRNHSAGFETRGYPGIFFIGAGHPSVSGSRLG